MVLLFKKHYQWYTKSWPSLLAQLRAPVVLDVQLLILQTNSLEIIMVKILPSIYFLF